MDQEGLYGDRLGTYLGLRSAPILSAGTAGKVEIAATLLQCDAGSDLIAPPAEDAYLVCLHLQDPGHRRMWLDGREILGPPPRKGWCSFADMRRAPSWELQGSLSSLTFYVSDTAFGAMETAREASVLPPNFRPAGCAKDKVMRDLGALLLAVLTRRCRANSLFIDHLLFAAGEHIRLTYSGGSAVAPSALSSRGGLAKWQENRAKEVIRAHLGDAVRISMIAEQCGLSASYFSSGFKKTTGLAPHQWLTRLRVDQAKDFLVNSRMSLAQIAIECGFADQSHFTRVFVRWVGVSPGAWRKAGTKSLWQASVGERI